MVKDVGKGEISALSACRAFVALLVVKEKGCGSTDPLEAGKGAHAFI